MAPKSLQSLRHLRINNKMAPLDTKPDVDVAHLERRGSDNAEGLSVAKKQINQDEPDIYIEALTRYPTDESIDAADEKRLVRKLDMRILPLLGICYFFYYVDKTTLYVPANKNFHA